VVLRHYVQANQKELSLSYHIANDVPRQLLGDEMRLRQIVTNLISNAVKFTNQGSVELCVRVLKTGEESAHEVLRHLQVQRESPVSHSGRDTAEMQVAGAVDALAVVTMAESNSARSASAPVTLLFEVLDTGIGIDHEDQGGLFTAFQQVNSTRSRQQGGTGLGLAISMRLVHLMGGHIAVTSNGVGHGSRFAFTVNLRPEVLEVTLPPLWSRPLAGRQLYIVSTCAPFIRSASSLATSVGLEPVILNAERTRGLLSGPSGWGSSMALIIDRESIPEGAVEGLGDVRGAGVMSDSNADRKSVGTMASGAGRMSSLKQSIVEPGNYFDSCGEFINLINAAMIQDWKSPTPPQSLPPAVMVLACSPSCVLSEHVSVRIGRPQTHAELTLI